MPQEISAERKAQQAAIQAAKEEDSQIWERQNFVIGCIEMERITDDILTPILSELASTIKQTGHQMDIILMDYESPLDDQLYNIGIRLTFVYEDKNIEVNAIADPSDFTFALTISIDDEPTSEKLFHFHQVIPFNLKRELRREFRNHFPQVLYSPTFNKNEKEFAEHKPPFRIQYDEAGSVSDVATTKTLAEAATMGSTFVKMFKKEQAITVVDADDNILC